MSDNIREVIIIGSGAAGLTAAIYAARADLKPLVIDGTQPGGQLTTTTEVENFPGFPEGIMGPELMERTRKQAERFGTEFIFDQVQDISLKGPIKKISLSGGQELQAHALIIATGAAPKFIGIEAEKKLMGRGVSTCATCDGAFFKNSDLIVVGGGDSALEEANFLTKFAKKVYVVHRRDSLRASKIMQERALKNPKIEFIWDTVVVDIKDVSKENVESAVLKNLKTGEMRELKIDGIFVAIGHTPNTAPFQKEIQCDEAGYILTHDGSKTNVEGVFAGGDCVDHVYRQAITAAGMGCMAALDAEKYLEAQKK